MNKRRIASSRVTRLASNEVFVFGSNLQGLHGGGAAHYAYEHFGAEWGQGVGLYGQSYAIPTMQGGVATIKPYVDGFIQFATAHSELDFLVTEIGCGIAGFTPQDIAPLFFRIIEDDIRNVYLPESFYAVYEDGSRDVYYKVCECHAIYPYTQKICPYCGSDTIMGNLCGNKDIIFKVVEYDKRRRL